MSFYSLQHSSSPIFLPSSNRTENGTAPLKKHICALFQMPSKVLNVIVEFLPPHGKMALRASSGFLCSAIPEARMDADERKAFKRLLKYDKDCKAERKGRWLHKLVCSGCHKKHGLSMFSKAQRGVDPSVRLCLGLQKRIRVCSHLNYSLPELRCVREALAEPESTHDLICNHPEHNLESRTFDQSGVRLLPKYPLSTNFSVVLTEPLLLFQIERHGVLTKSWLSQNLCRVAPYSCPHLKLSEIDAYIWENCDTRTPSAERHSTGFGWKVWSGRCAQKGCLTSFDLIRAPVSGQRWDEVYTVVRRDLGNLQKATDPNWLRQVEIGKVG